MTSPPMRASASPSTRSTCSEALNGERGTRTKLRSPLRRYSWPPGPGRSRRVAPAPLADRPKGVAGCRSTSVLEPVPAVRVEPVDPIAQHVAVHAAAPRGFRPVHSVEHRRQRQKTLALARVRGEGALGDGERILRRSLTNCRRYPRVPPAEADAAPPHRPSSGSHSPSTAQPCSVRRV